MPFLDTVQRFVPQPKPRDDEAHANLKLTAWVLTLWIAGSLFSVLLWTTVFLEGRLSLDVHKSLHTFGQAIIIAGGAFAVGTLFGFLFGIPKTLQDQGATQPPTQDKPDREAAVQATNTNLEQISDWLTKILVGVGLIQLNNLRGEFRDLANYFAISASPAITLAMLLNFSVAGFLTGYLLTRLFLTGAFVNVERSIRGIRESTTRAEELQKAGKFEAALNRFEDALKQITPNTSPEQRRTIYEGVIFNSLYEHEPQGFQKAIEYAKQYLRDEKAPASAKTLAYLSAAYGQQYTYERDHGASTQRLAEVRAQALDAARRALETDPGVIGLLQMMWDPAHPSKSPNDDDLEVFFEEEDFRKLLGPKEEPRQPSKPNQPSTEGTVTSSGSAAGPGGPQSTAPPPNATQSTATQQGANQSTETQPTTNQPNTNQPAAPMHPTTTQPPATSQEGPERPAGVEGTERDE